MIDVIPEGSIIHVGNSRPGVRLAGGGSALPYDAIPSVAAAYGMRRLRSAYTGNLLRLRRSSDNAEQDFGYVANGDLDAAAIATWLTATTGYVVAWYDQSGNSYNLTLSTAASQPLYVASGQNSKPIARLDGSDDYLDFVAGALGIFRNKSYGAILVVTKPSEATRGDILEVSINVVGTARAALIHSRVTTLRFEAGGRRTDADSYAMVESNADHSQTCKVVTAEYDWGNSDLRLYQNGSLVASRTDWQTSGNTSDTASVAARLGANTSVTPANYYQGDIAELVIANAAWTAGNRAAAEVAANAYWGVY